MLRVSKILLAMARLSKPQEADRANLFDLSVPREEKKEIFKRYYADRLIFEGDHWLWTGGVEHPKGGGATYGELAVLNPHDPLASKKNTTGRLHLKVYEMFNGKIKQPLGPDGGPLDPNDPEYLTVDHTCQLPLCCNPDHLEKMTKAENSKLVGKRLRDAQAEHDKQKALDQGSDYLKAMSDTRSKIFKLIFNAWKQKASQANAAQSIPDYWYYLAEFREMYYEWLQELKYSPDEHVQREALRHLNNFNAGDIAGLPPLKGSKEERRAPYDGRQQRMKSPEELSRAAELKRNTALRQQKAEAQAKLDAAKAKLQPV